MVISVFKAILSTKLKSMIACLSHVANLTSVVAQRSGIGPLFLLVFINDLIAVLEQYGVYAKLFADDRKLRQHSIPCLVTN